MSRAITSVYEEGIDRPNKYRTDLRESSCANERTNSLNRVYRLGGGYTWSNSGPGPTAAEVSEPIEQLTDEIADELTAEELAIALIPTKSKTQRN